MMDTAQDTQNVTSEELAAARRYPMEIAWSPDDEVFLASFPDVPGVMIHGATPEEAAANGEEVIVAWYTALKDAGLPIPAPTVSARRVRVAAPRRYDGDRVRAIRRRLAVSQKVFADLLNVSLSTVRSWEQGWRVPDGPSLRLIEIAERSPDTLLTAMTPAHR